MFNKKCFLCSPDKSLVVWEGEFLLALVGLGPITKKYYVVGTKQHFRSFADTKSKTAYLAELGTVRRILSSDGRPLLLTENGRVPVCRTDGSNHEEHCFHAHVLLFDSPDITPIADGYFGEKQIFGSVDQAYDYSITKEPFHLVSSSFDDYTVFTKPLNIPRQLFRALVAHVAGDDRSEDWQSNPRYDLAREMARETRLKLGGLNAR